MVLKKIEFDERLSKRLFEELNSSSTGYIVVNQMSDGEYVLRANIRLLGGGLFGASAGAWVGKFVVYGVCHGAIGLVAFGATCVGGPVAGYAVAGGLESTFGTAIEILSTTAALACGIAGGVATGVV